MSSVTLTQQHGGMSTIKVCIGSTNPAKISAVRHAFSHYFAEVELVAVEVDSGVSVQPNSADEMMKGARNRAELAFRDCDYSVGIEAGMISFPTVTGYFLTAVAVVFDGKNFFAGGAPMVELPEQMVHKIVKGEELGPLFDKLMDVKDSKLNKGVVGHLTHDVITRDKALEQAVIMALVPVVNTELYGSRYEQNI